MSSAPSIPRLTRETDFDTGAVTPPILAHAKHPERILQFGTGAFLRGFSNVFVDAANRAGAFNGRIVVVGSTGSGRTRQINDQEGLYTVVSQGVEAGEVVDRCSVVGCVSRAIACTTDWPSVLALVRSPDLQIVVSNTTEVGIRLDDDDRPALVPPRSYPGKLTVLLHERARAFDFAPSAGLTILCCELIEDNGDLLREIVLSLASRWGFSDRFVGWVRDHNVFCNTLVDRIVPGRPEESSLRRLESKIGYRDELLIQAEPFSFWAIEGDAALRERLAFARDAAEIVVASDIAPYRIRKVRILNGAHSAMVPLSYLCGNDTVAETMEHPLTSSFVRQVVLEEIVPSLEGELDGDDAASFARQVLDRFANPFVHHELLSIALQQTSKMDVRVLPSLRAFTKKKGRLPQGILSGFAAFLMFATGQGRAATASLPADDRAGRLRAHWQATGQGREDDFVHRVAADRELWSNPLDDLPGFCDAATARLRAMQRDGVARTLEASIFSRNGQNT